MKTEKRAVLRLRHNPTGTEVDHIEEDFNRWCWGSGNFACDCNRGIFFGDSGGVLPDESPDYNEDDDSSLCGNSEFTVLRVTCDGIVTEGDPRND